MNMTIDSYSIRHYILCYYRPDWFSEIHGETKHCIRAGACLFPSRLVKAELELYKPRLRACLWEGPSGVTRCMEVLLSLQACQSRAQAEIEGLSVGRTQRCDSVYGGFTFPPGLSEQSASRDWGLVCGKDPAVWLGVWRFYLLDFCSLSSSVK